MAKFTGLLGIGAAMPGFILPGTLANFGPSTATVVGPGARPYNVGTTFQVVLDVPVISGSVTVTPSVTGATISPASGTIGVGVRSTSFTITPAAAATFTVTTTASPALGYAPWIFNAYTPATAFAAALSPMSGLTGAAFTVTITLLPSGAGYNGTITGTPGFAECALFAAQITTWNHELGPKTMTFTPGVPGSATIAFTNNGGLTNAGSVTYDCTAYTTSPTIVIGSSYVAVSGQTIAIFPVAASGGAARYATAVNSLPWISISGATPVQCSASWTPGTSSCVLVTVPGGIVVGKTDTVAIAAPSGWMTTTAGTLQALSILSVPNYVMKMPPLVTGVVPTFKPGFNLSSGCFQHGRENFYRNLRFRGVWGNGIGTLSNQAYPTTLSQANAYLDVFDFANNTGLPGDLTQTPGLPGYYAVGWDDLAYGGGTGANRCNLSLTGTSGKSTVSIVSGYTNSGSNGIGQFAVYKVIPASGSTVVNIPVQLELTMPNFLVGVNNAPNIANVVVLGPRDFMTRYAGTITVTNGSSAVTFSVAQSGLTGLNLVLESDLTGGLYAISSGSGTSWNLGSNYAGTSGVFQFWGTMPASGPISFDRTQPYAISAYLTSQFPNGVGVVRFMDTTTGFGSGGSCPMTETWECHQQAEFTYNRASGYRSTTATISSVRPFTTASSPYLYGENFGNPWLSASSLSIGLGTAAQGATDTLVLSSATANTDPIFYGLLLCINAGAANQEFVRVMAVNSDNQTLTVERGSCAYTVLTDSPSDTTSIPPATAPAHSALEPITIYGRISWGGNLSLFGTASTQIAEAVCSAPHGLKNGVYTNTMAGSMSGVKDTQGNQFSYISQFGVWATGPSTFVMIGLNGATTAASTLATTTALTGVSLTITNPVAGLPWEAPGQIAAALSANVHYNIPLMASDSLIYNIAVKALANTMVGGTVYVELADEPWGSHAIGQQITMMARVLQSYAGGNGFFALRSAQCGNIFRSVYATAGRASEIAPMLNVVNSGGSWLSPAIYLTNNGKPCIYRVLTINTYSGSEYAAYTPGSGSYFVNSITPQSGSTNPDMIGAFSDYAWHNIAFNTATSSGSFYNQLASFNSIAPGYNTAINNYNSANSTSYNVPAGGSNAVVGLYGYEGDLAGLCPGNMPNNPLYSGADGQGTEWIRYALNHDWYYDPAQTIYQQAYYAQCQQAGFVDVAAYTYGYPNNYSAMWNYVEWLGQEPGAGDGSDGKLNNRLSRATPGMANSINQTVVNQPSQTVSVRAYALQSWMGRINAALLACSPTSLGVGTTTTVTFTLSGNTWSITPVITPSGTPTSDVSWSVGSITLVNSTTATVSVTTGTTTGTVTWTDSASGATTPQNVILEPALSCSPGSIDVLTTTTVTFTLANDTWSTTPAITASGTPTGDALWSVGAITLTSSTTATASVIVGSTTGTVTWTDSTSGTSTTESVIVPVALFCSPGVLPVSKTTAVTFLLTGTTWGSTPTITASGTPTSDVSWSVGSITLVNSTTATVSVTTGTTTGTVTWTNSATSTTVEQAVEVVSAGRSQSSGFDICGFVVTTSGGLAGMELY